MKHLVFLSSAVLLLVLWNGCKPKEEAAPVDKSVAIVKSSVSQHLENQFSSWTTFICQDELTYYDTLKAFYSDRNYKPLWFDALMGDSASWADLDHVFKYGNLHGMDYRYYDLPLVDYYRPDTNRTENPDSIYRILSELEIVVSNGILSMYNDIANGRTDPKDVYGYTYMLPQNNWKKLDYFAFLKSDTKESDIDKIHFGDTTYQELLKVMTYYLKKKKEARQKAIDFSEHPKIEKGDSGEIILKVIARLKERNLPDKGIQTIKDTAVYTNELAKQIKKLQEKYSLTPDGIMGFKTYRIINNSPKDKIDQVKANLERQRWFNKPNKGVFVYINLPEYNAYIHWEDSVKSMKVCIGKNLPDKYDEMVKEYTDSGWLYKLPKNMETPQIASKITYLVLNPTWTVPYSIVKREMLGRLRRDPGYLTRRGYKVYRNGEEVNADSINWRKVNANAIPYKIVQNPGDDNSLGRVKFMFNNPFSIYLHDTPLKSKFRLTQRAVSHGCVRLEKPILFGEYLMQNSKEYDSDDFRIMMGYEPLDEQRLKDYDPTDTTALIQPLEETTKLRLNKPIPLYLDYRTIYYSKDWTLNFCYDIYDQNKLILDAMNR